MLLPPLLLLLPFGGPDLEEVLYEHIRELGYGPACAFLKHGRFAREELSSRPRGGRCRDVLPQPLSRDHHGLVELRVYVNRVPVPAHGLARYYFYEKV